MPLLSAKVPRHPHRTRSLLAGLAAAWGRTAEARRLVDRLVPDGSLLAVHRVARDQVVYTTEVAEIVQMPGVTLVRGAGDCEDKTLLIGGMVVVLGWQWRPMLLASHRRGGLRTIAPGEPVDGGGGWRPFHVWPQVRQGGVWVDVEACDPGAELGEHPTAVMRRLSAKF